MSLWSDFDYDYDPSDREPVPVICDYCGKEMTFTKKGGMWVPVELETLKPHECDFSALLEANK